ncbi:hypothetical protein BH10BAC6_BH10BAC6_01800 [soil metagenome]
MQMLDLAFDAVVERGKHLSSVLAALFAQIKPDQEEATAIRHELYHRIRALGMPSFLRERIEQAYGPSVAEAIISSSMVDAPVFIRANTLRAKVSDVQQALPGSILRTDFGFEALEIPEPYGLFRTQAYVDGWFEQQDLASQRVSETLRLQPGMRVVDACAGAGGKSLHMAALMKNTGRIIALDVAEDKLNTLRKRAAHAGVSIIDPRPIYSTKIIKRLADSADRVLLDVPCSGTGVLRRNPDIMIHTSETSLLELQDIQADILRRNARSAKPGGFVCYANCSVLPEEGRLQIERFLQESGSAFTLLEEWQTLPHELDCDGFYVALMQRS